MDSNELKLAIIEKIIACDNLEVLAAIKEIIDNSFVSEVNESSPVYNAKEEVRVFNEWQQKRIDKALQQYENGECISDEEAQKEIQAWLEE